MKIIIATFALVFLRAIQQQNVIHRQYVFAAITPFAIATAEVASVLLVVNTGWSSIPYVGIGGCAGVITAMYLHNKYLR
jgi:hypothetical protein